MRYIISIMGLLLMLGSCRKTENADYRDQYTGEYEFHEYIRCSDSQGNYTYDTFVCMGSIRKYGDEQLRIIYRAKPQEPVLYTTMSSSSGIKGIMYPHVESKTGKLSYPDMIGQFAYFDDCSVKNGVFTAHFGTMKAYKGDMVIEVSGIKKP